MSGCYDCFVLEREIQESRAECARLREALETWQSLGVECFVDGNTAPRPDCTCNTCETFREGAAALGSAPAKEPTTNPVDAGSSVSSSPAKETEWQRAVREGEEARAPAKADKFGDRVSTPGESEQRHGASANGGTGPLPSHSSAKADDFWDAVKKDAEEVRKLPAYKRAGVSGVHGSDAKADEPKPCTCPNGKHHICLEAKCLCEWRAP